MDSHDHEGSHIVVVGAGVAGLAAALSLTKFTSGPPPPITVLEARSELLPQGGTINVIPSGVRYLDGLGVLARLRERGLGAEVSHLEVYAADTGFYGGTLRFSNEEGSGIGDPPFTAWRLKRMDMLQAMLDQVRSLDNLKVAFGKKVKKISVSAGQATIACDDGSAVHASLVLGCDGIHSAVRRYLDQDRIAQYTGLAVVNGYADIESADERTFKPGIGGSVAIKSQQGSLLVSHYEATRTKLSVVGAWEAPDVGTRDGWQAKGADQAAIEEELKTRFGQGGVKGVDALVDAVDTWQLYPVYKLSPTGPWWAERVMLLGDAAHAMPPQGESTTIAMEDGIVFARFLAARGRASLAQVFAAYERYRRVRTDAAYREAERRFGWNKDAGWVSYQITTLLRPILLWWSPDRRRPIMEANLMKQDLDGLDKME